MSPASARLKCTARGLEMAEGVLEHMRQLSHEIRDLDVGHEVRYVDINDITPLSFYRDYVSRNKPVIITGALKGWPALKNWHDEYLLQAMGNALVNVAVTPDGRADAVKQMPQGQEVFALPHFERMPFPLFITALQTPVNRKIVYAQSQNNSMAEEFPALMLDISELHWASEAFGSSPEATNLWIGSDESVTSFHKDHYENLYAVITGVKTFSLLPPSDAYRLSIRRYPVAQYERGSTTRLQLRLKEPKESMSDEERAHDKEFWSDDLPRPLVANVMPGEVLYLPSLWYHCVRQMRIEGQAVTAVNFWYDMPFDCKAAYAKFCEELAGIA